MGDPLLLQTLIQIQTVPEIKADIVEHRITARSPAASTPPPAVLRNVRLTLSNGCAYCTTAELSRPQACLV